MMTAEETNPLVTKKSKSSFNLGINKFFNVISTLFYVPPNIYELIEKDNYETLQKVITKFKECGDDKRLKNYLNQFDSKKQSPIYWAVNHQKYGCAQVLLENGVDANYIDKSSLGMTLIYMSAVEDKDVQMTVLLLKHKANLDTPTAKGKIPSHLASDIIKQAKQFNQTDIVNFASEQVFEKKLN